MEKVIQNIEKEAAEINERKRILQKSIALIAESVSEKDQTRLVEAMRNLN